MRVAVGFGRGMESTSAHATACEAAAGSGRVRDGSVVLGPRDHSGQRSLRVER